MEELPLKEKHSQENKKKKMIKPYYRLEITNYFLKQKLTEIEMNFSFFADNNLVRVEHYDNLFSVKQRIINLTDVFLESFPEKARYWAKENQKKHNIKEAVDYNKLDRYPTFIIANEFKNYAFLGYCYKGWYTPSSFPSYVLKTIKQTYGEEKYLKYFDCISVEKFLFDMPHEPLEASELDLLSDDIIDIHLESSLLNKKIEKRDEIYHEEIIRRNIPIQSLEEIYKNVQNTDKND